MQTLNTFAEDSQDLFPNFLILFNLRFSDYVITPVIPTKLSMILFFCLKPDMMDLSCTSLSQMSFAPLSMICRWISETMLKVEE
jgi:hypothetical protein